MEPYAGVDYENYNSPYLIVRYPHKLQRERKGVGKISPIGWAHLHLSADFQNRLLNVNTSTK